MTCTACEKGCRYIPRLTNWRAVLNTTLHHCIPAVLWTPLNLVWLCSCGESCQCGKGETSHLIAVTADWACQSALKSESNVHQ